MEMTIAADSYLAMILPEDISKRIADFITGQTNFPFIGENELMCIFCFYGKNKKVNGNKELQRGYRCCRIIQQTICLQPLAGIRTAQNQK